jgi:23S rRNA pseudouridine1911/1915/1917 synthase
MTALLIDQSRVVTRDENCCVINKLSGESAEQPVTLEDGSSWTAAHRLDVPVSGCLLLASRPCFLSFFAAAFARQAGGAGTDAAPLIKKRYWAIVEKPHENSPVKPAEDWKEITHWILTDTKRNKSIAYSQKKPGSKKALLRYRLAGLGDNYLFLEIDLLTGRHHQIRAQLAALGLRVKGDLKYGARRSEKGGGIRLHAASLSFPNPAPSGGVITARADPPVMDGLWEAFAAIGNLAPL